ncbi:cobalamin biosynthesis protein CbiX [Bacillus pseudomycoides]|uniref:CcdC family protein n=1 Tax=Bacillus pseudomycoides TaxID=64104 RepID=UPI000BF191BD|nr:cytochrome c biogenesis protein CcdC [Bacillus pseudomycoides]PEI95682.1 cobalamin biosynthesis protein CbiX [Bacillus pseudomycoides]
MGTGSPNITFFLFIAVLIVLLRMRSMNRPIKRKGRRILFPIFFLIPGLYLYSTPIKLEIWQIGLAAAIGIILSIPLVILSGYEVREDNQIYTKKSVAFIATFLVIVLIRYYFRSRIEGLDPQSVGVLFFTVALCYLIPWRIGGYLKFRKMYHTKQQNALI